MELNKVQITELEKPLDRSRVKQREQSGRQVSYIEGWHAQAEANRIFGFDGWKSETTYCKEACRYQVKVGKTNPVDGWKVGYEAHVRLTVGCVVREGVGHGSGHAKDLFDAIESAAKEAETDAMKRAFKSFGNVFGLALYDKTQANVCDTAAIEAAEKMKQELALPSPIELSAEIAGANTVLELEAIKEKYKRGLNLLKKEDAHNFTLTVAKFTVRKADILTAGGTSTKKTTEEELDDSIPF